MRPNHTRFEPGQLTEPEGQTNTLDGKASKKEIAILSTWVNSLTICKRAVKPIEEIQGLAKTTEETAESAKQLQNKHPGF